MGIFSINNWFYIIYNRNEKGSFYAIDIGGTFFRIMYCSLGNLKGEIELLDDIEVEIPINRKVGNVQNLFDFIVANFKIFIQMRNRYQY